MNNPLNRRPSSWTAEERKAWDARMEKALAEIAAAQPKAAAPYIPLPDVTVPMTQEERRAILTKRKDLA